MTECQERVDAPLPRTRRLTTRIAPRHRVALPAQLRERGRSAVDVTVHNLSAHGFQSDSLYRLKPDTLVWIRLPGLAPIAASVRWYRTNHIGCTFAVPLHAAICASLVARHALGETRQAHDMLQRNKTTPDLSHA